MSHRKRGTSHPHGKTDTPESAASSAYNWSFTRRILGTHVTAIELAQNSLLGQDEFFKLVESLDLTESLRAKLDRVKIANIPVNVRDLFVRQYLSACVTAMAKNQGVLVPLERSVLVSFPKTDEDQPAGTSVQAHQKPDDGSYILIDPALKPFDSQIPCFNGTFLGMLQTRFQKLLKAKRIYPADTDDKVILDGLMDIAFDKITEERMFGECRAAIAEYFDYLLGGKDPAYVMVISKTGAPFVFLWLMASGLLDDMIVSLLRGKPLMKPMDLPGTPKNIAYEPSEFGNTVGLWKLDPETKRG